MQISVFGAGYVGLVQAAAFAEVGHTVVCMDIDHQRIELLQNGQSPLHEPGLTALLTDNLSNSRLTFTTDASTAVNASDLLFIAVGTPSNSDGSANLSYLYAAIDAIGQYMNRHKIIVVKSTVPVGTADIIKHRLQVQLHTRDHSDLDFAVVSNPEFVKEGAAVNDCMRPDRIIIGSDNSTAIDMLREAYRPFNRNHDKILVMDNRSAELTKYAANCMLAAKISFMNEIAHLAELLDADIEQVRLGIGSDPRIGHHFIYPGAGFGGSCFPKDLRALIQTAQGLDFEPLMLMATAERNQRQKNRLFEKIWSHYGGDLRNRVFALWGLAFKPNTDDMREAPACDLLQALWEAGARVHAYDPEAMETCQQHYGNRADLNLCGTKQAALKGAEALIIITEWHEFRALDVKDIATLLAQPLIFDGRNLYDPQRLRQQGISYYGIGR